MAPLSTAGQNPVWRAAMTEPVSPADCTTMTEVRAGVDAVDAKLVALLAVRFGYMDAAARIKSDRTTVRDEARKAEVLANVARHADAAGLDMTRLTAIWDVLVEQSIAHELVRWDSLRA
jgi:isochorismate pyruvate lyase